MNVITIDFETYYDKLYSLSKITTEEYIRSPLFEVIGVAVKVNDQPTEWFSGTMAATRKFLNKFDFDSSLAVAHNAVFDMAILNWHFDIRPKRIGDTLSMARALHGTNVGGSLAYLAQLYNLGEKGTEIVNALGKRRKDFTPLELTAYGKYCINDVELTHTLFYRLMSGFSDTLTLQTSSAGFPLAELKLIDLTIRMFTEPEIEIDGDFLTHELLRVQNEKLKLLESVDHDSKSLSSNPQFADLLRQHGVDPPVKISPTTGKPTYAFSKADEGFRALQDHPDLKVQALVAARLGVKSTLAETRIERLIDIAKRGTLPVALRYYAAHTGRWGGADAINMQNLPRGSVIKDALSAPDGYVFGLTDSSQIEARMLAWLAGEVDLIETFEKNNAEIAAGAPKELHQHDPYKLMASRIYNKPPNSISLYPERFVGKWTILGSGYGLGAVSYQRQLKTAGVALELEECERIISVYRSTFSAIPEFWKMASRAIKAMLRDQYMEFGPGGVIKVEGKKGILLPNGLYLQYPNLRVSQNKETGEDEIVYDTRRGKATIAVKLYGGKLVENICQALARIVIGEQMLTINKIYKVVMTVHDSVVCLVPESSVNGGVMSASEYISMCMRMRPKWAPDLPLNCETEIAKTYGGA